MKDNAIVLIRIISMLFIIICHLGSYYGSAAVGQLFNVGVPIFFFLSGFLYGKKNISGWGAWSKLRWVTLMIPLYVWLFLLTFAGWLINTETPHTLSWLLVILNLQGISFITDDGRWAQMTGGLGHLWFMTALMLCYACLPILQKAKKRIHALSTKSVITLILISIIVKCSFDYWFKIHLGYLLTFCIGYYWSKKYRVPSDKSFLWWIAIAMTCCVVRLISKQLWGESFLYLHVIVSISQVLLAIAIFNLVYYAYTKRPLKYNIMHHAGGGHTIYR